MAAKLNLLFFKLLFIASAAAAVRADGDADAVFVSSEPDCIYTIYVQTGFLPGAGTDSSIALTLYDNTGLGFRIKNLASWGGRLGHSYFEKGNLDVFKGTGPCLSDKPCKMNITSDGTGSFPSWYCDYVEVIITGPNTPSAQQTFKVDTWLANGFPFKPTFIKDTCFSSSSTSGDRRHVNLESTCPLLSSV